MRQNMHYFICKKSDFFGREAFLFRPIHAREWSPFLTPSSPSSLNLSLTFHNVDTQSFISSNHINDNNKVLTKIHYKDLN